MELNKVKTIIRQEAFALEPEFQRELGLSDEINWCFAILFGQSGHLQVPLACDADGVLAVADPSLVGTTHGVKLADYFDRDQAQLPFYSSIENLGLAEHLDSNLHHAPFYSWGDAMGLGDYFDSTVAEPPLYSTNDGYGLADYFDSLITTAPLYDDISGSAHSIANELVAHHEDTGLWYTLAEMFADVWDLTSHCIRVCA